MSCKYCNSSKEPDIFNTSEVWGIISTIKCPQCNKVLDIKLNSKPAQIKPRLQHVKEILKELKYASKKLAKNTMGSNEDKWNV